MSRSPNRPLLHSLSADMNRVDAIMAIKFAVLGMIFTPLVTLFGAMGIGWLKILLERAGSEHHSSH